MLKLMRESRVCLFLRQFQAGIGIHKDHVAAVGVILIPWVKIVAVKIPGYIGILCRVFKIVFNIQQQDC